MPTGGTIVAPERNLTSDSARTNIRYKTAVEALHRSLKATSELGGALKMSLPEEDPKHASSEEWQAKIDSLIDARTSTSTKHRHLIQRVFLAVSPFAKNFLAVVIQGQAVILLSNRLLTCNRCQF